MDRAVAEGHRQRPAPDEVVTQAELGDEADGVAVATEEVVVELLEPDPGLDLEAGGQATGDRLPLEDDHILAALGEPVGDGQAQGSGAKHGGTSCPKGIRGVRRP